MFTLLCRQSGQHSADDLRSRDFRRELEEREHSAREKRSTRDRGNKLWKSFPPQTPNFIIHNKIIVEANNNVFSDGSSNVITLLVVLRCNFLYLLTNNVTLFV